MYATSPRPVTSHSMKSSHQPARSWRRWANSPRSPSEAKTRVTSVRTGSGPSIPSSERAHCQLNQTR